MIKPSDPDPVSDYEMADKQQYCKDCRDDFYNHRDGPGFDGATKCWSLKDAQVVTRYRLHWWTAPTVPGAYTEVRTLDCHHEPGQFAFQKQLPSWAVDPHLLDAREKARG